MMRPKMRKMKKWRLLLISCYDGHDMAVAVASFSVAVLVAVFENVGVAYLAAAEGSGYKDNMQ